MTKTSLMPAFDPKRLSDSDLTDLIGYLGDAAWVRRRGPLRRPMRALLMVTHVFGHARGAAARSGNRDKPGSSSEGFRTDGSKWLDVSRRTTSDTVTAR